MGENHSRTCAHCRAAWSENAAVIERKAVIRNHDGIHCRPSVCIVKAVADYAGRITVSSDRGATDLKSVMTLMTLALGYGCRVSVRVDGPDEQRVCEEVVGLFERCFDFPHPASVPPINPPSPVV